MDLEDIFVFKSTIKLPLGYIYFFKCPMFPRFIFESHLRNYGIFCDLPAIYRSFHHRSVYTAIFLKILRLYIYRYLFTS